MKIFNKYWISYVRLRFLRWLAIKLKIIIITTTQIKINKVIQMSTDKYEIMKRKAVTSKMSHQNERFE